MKKKSKLMGVLVFVFCMGLFSHASADGILLGEWGVGSFDTMVQISTDPIFSSPGMTLDKSITANMYNDHGSTYGASWDSLFDTWFVSAGTSYLATAQGDAIDIMGWYAVIDISYASTPFSFDFYAYYENTIIDWATIVYDGGTYGDGGYGSSLNNNANYSFVFHPLNQVPEPATWLLLGLGLLSIVSLGKLGTGSQFKRAEL